MAFAKRGTRKIVVNDIDFAWITREHEQLGKDVIRVQLADGHSSQLIVENMWFGFQKLLADNQSPGRWCLPADKRCNVTPSFIAAAIKHAFELGWTPTSQGDLTLIGQQQADRAVFI